MAGPALSVACASITSHVGCSAGDRHRQSRVDGLRMDQVLNGPVPGPGLLDPGV